MLSTKYDYYLLNFSLGFYVINLARLLSIVSYTFVDLNLDDLVQFFCSDSDSAKY